MKIQMLLVLIASSFLSSCLMSEPSEHREFMSRSDCYVYECEVASEMYVFGKVEYVKMNNAGKCAKLQLQNTFLLHFNKDIIEVYGQHPKHNIRSIIKEYAKHASDTTKLGTYFADEDGYSVTVNRLCKDKKNVYYNRFILWKSLDFETENEQSKCISQQILTTFHDWDKNKNSEINASNLIQFLKNPIQLQEFKKKKNREYVTTSVQNGKAYYFNPKNKDSTYYNYNFIPENVASNGVNKIKVFKHGKNKHSYEDDTETLIELNITNKDEALGEANLVGLSKTALEAKFGKAKLIYKGQSIYSYKNKILCVDFEDAVIKSFQYIHLNTTGMTDALLEQIFD
ncbi:hypothetical protein [uncultured Kordia sp.]|uniref:hypothetical protein n=1 Tax=uncultured Kordia sp. TaxID=507699 RepID=UPI00260DE09A|nr:hypothetical protein [uncultured Kordia sp.]